MYEILKNKGPIFKSQYWFHAVFNKPLQSQRKLYSRMLIFICLFHLTKNIRKQLGKFYLNSSIKQ